MSAPPSPPGNSGGGEVDNTTAGQPGLTREDMIREWMDRRIQYAQLTGLQGGIGIPRTSVAVVPPMALYGAAPAPMAMSQYYAYCQQQQRTAYNQPHARASIQSTSLQVAEMSRRRLVKPSDTRKSRGVRPDISSHLSFLDRSRAQDQQSQELDTTEEGTNSVPAQPRAESQGVSLEEALKRRITEKIKEKLKQLKPNLSELDQAVVLESLIREQEPQQAPRNELSNAADQITGSVCVKSSIETRTPSVSGKKPSVSGKKPSVSSTILQPQAKKRKTAAKNQPAKPMQPAKPKQPATPTQISDSLDKVVDSLQDENIRSALQEDREKLRTKRREMQQIYEEQIRDNMKSRLAMYTKLQILAKLIANIHSNSNSKNSRNNNHMDGAIDMIHLSLRNYRMLEDTSDRLLSAILRKNE